MFQITQEEEVKTWLVEDQTKRQEKILREKIRYPLLAKQMGLSFLDTSNMVVMDIGCGPIGGVSTVIQSKLTIRVDSLGKEYAKYFGKNINFIKAEELKGNLSLADLIIVTNALDHFENPTLFLNDLKTYMKPGSFFAHLHTIDNAITHPHPAHVHNLNPDTLHSILDTDFETVWELTYQKDNLRYGWFKYNGKVGQPAFANLFRKTTGYNNETK